MSQSLSLSFYDRQMGVLGHAAHSKVRSMHVLVVNADPVGAEVLKALALSGVSSLTIHDDGYVEVTDLSTCSYVRKQDVGSRRGPLLVKYLQQLNGSVKVSQHTGDLPYEFVHHFDAVVCCNVPEAQMQRLNDYCRSRQIFSARKELVSKPIAFVAVAVRGMTGFVFTDLGDKVRVRDHTSHIQTAGTVESVTVVDAVGTKKTNLRKWIKQNGVKTDKSQGEKKSEGEGTSSDTSDDKSTDTSSDKDDAKSSDKSKDNEKSSDKSKDKSKDKFKDKSQDKSNEKAKSADQKESEKGKTGAADADTGHFVLLDVVIRGTGRQMNRLSGVQLGRALSVGDFLTFKDAHALPSTGKDKEHQEGLAEVRTKLQGGAKCHVVSLTPGEAGSCTARVGLRLGPVKVVEASVKKVNSGDDSAALVLQRGAAVFQSGFVTRAAAVHVVQHQSYADSISNPFVGERSRVKEDTDFAGDDKEPEEKKEHGNETVVTQSRSRMIQTDLTAGEDRPKQLYVALRALFQFEQLHGRLPRLNDTRDADETVRIAKAMNQEAHELRALAEKMVEVASGSAGSEVQGGLASLIKEQQQMENKTGGKGASAARKPKTGGEQRSQADVNLQGNLVIGGIELPFASVDHVAVAVSQVDEALVRLVAIHARAFIAPVCAVFANIAAFEVLKGAGVFAPLDQYLFVDFLVCLGRPDCAQGAGESSFLANLVRQRTSRTDDFTPVGNRWDHLVAVFGKAVCQRLNKLRCLVAGAGGLGCEFLRNLCLIGVASRRSMFTRRKETDALKARHSALLAEAKQAEGTENEEIAQLIYQRVVQEQGQTDGDSCEGEQKKEQSNDTSAAGVEGHILVCDGNAVGLSNLHRQSLYREEDVGSAKATVACEALKSINADVDVRALPCRLTDTACGLSSDYLLATAQPGKEPVAQGRVLGSEFWQHQVDLILCAVDNQRSRLLLDKMAILHNIPMIEAGTRGSMASTTCVIPHLTQSLADMWRPSQSSESGHSGDRPGQPDGPDGNRWTSDTMFPSLASLVLPDSQSVCVDVARAELFSAFVSASVDMHSFVDNTEAFVQFMFPTGRVLSPSLHWQSRVSRVHRLRAFLALRAAVAGYAPAVPKNVRPSDFAVRRGGSNPHHPFLSRSHAVWSPSPDYVSERKLGPEKLAFALDAVQKNLLAKTGWPSLRSFATCVSLGVAFYTLHFQWLPAALHKCFEPTVALDDHVRGKHIRSVGLSALKSLDKKRRKGKGKHGGKKKAADEVKTGEESLWVRGGIRMPAYGEDLFVAPDANSSSSSSAKQADPASLKFNEEVDSRVLTVVTTSASLFGRMFGCFQSKKVPSTEEHGKLSPAERPVSDLAHLDRTLDCVKELLRCPHFSPPPRPQLQVSQVDKQGKTSTGSDKTPVVHVSGAFGAVLARVSAALSARHLPAQVRFLYDAKPEKEAKRADPATPKASSGGSGGVDGWLGRLTRALNLKPSGERKSAGKPEKDGKDKKKKSGSSKDGAPRHPHAAQTWEDLLLLLSTHFSALAQVMSESESDQQHVVGASSPPNASSPQFKAHRKEEVNKLNAVLKHVQVDMRAVESHLRKQLPCDRKIRNKLVGGKTPAPNTLSSDNQAALNALLSQGAGRGSNVPFDPTQFVFSLPPEDGPVVRGAVPDDTPPLPALGDPNSTSQSLSGRGKKAKLTPVKSKPAADSAESVLGAVLPNYSAERSLVHPVSYAVENDVWERIFLTGVANRKMEALGLNPWQVHEACQYAEAVRPGMFSTCAVAAGLATLELFPLVSCPKSLLQEREMRGSVASQLPHYTALRRQDGNRVVGYCQFRQVAPGDSGEVAQAGKRTLQCFRDSFVNLGVNTYALSSVTEARVLKTEQQLAPRPVIAVPDRYTPWQHLRLLPRLGESADSITMEDLLAHILTHIGRQASAPGLRGDACAELLRRGYACACGPDGCALTEQAAGGTVSLNLVVENAQRVLFTRFDVAEAKTAQSVWRTPLRHSILYASARELVAAYSAVSPAARSASDGAKSANEDPPLLMARTFSRSRGVSRASAQVRRTGALHGWLAEESEADTSEKKAEPKVTLVSTKTTKLPARSPVLRLAASRRYDGHSRGRVTTSDGAGSDDDSAVSVPEALLEILRRALNAELEVLPEGARASHGHSVTQLACLVEWQRTVTQTKEEDKESAAVDDDEDSSDSDVPGVSSGARKPRGKSGVTVTTDVILPCVLFEI